MKVKLLLSIAVLLFWFLSACTKSDTTLRSSQVTLAFTMEEIAKWDNKDVIEKDATQAQADDNQNKTKGEKEKTRSRRSQHQQTVIITGAVLEKVKQLAEPPSDYGLLERIKNAGNALMGTPSQKESAADDVVTIRFDCYGNSKQTAAVNAKLVAIRNE